MTTTIDPTILTADELAPMLRAWAQGYFPGEAAVELIIRHQRWLHRTDFLREMVDAVVDGWGPEGVVVPMASIHWERVETFLAEAPSSSSEAANAVPCPMPATLTPPTSTCSSIEPSRLAWSSWARTSGRR